MLNRIVKSGVVAMALVLFTCLFCGDASSTRIKNLCEIQGARGNSLKGIGIVVGLARTGDKAKDALRAQEEMLRRISVLQERLATGRRVNRPSDDPIDARRAMNLRTIIAKNEQFQANISDSSPHLDESASILMNVVDIILRTLELTTQGANETLGQEQLNAIALEIDELLETVVVAGNHRTNNRSIFAGTQTLSDAFNVTRVAGQITAVTYAGTTSPSRSTSPRVSARRST